MKKTLNINIGNSIIHIEEDACDLLNNYLIEVKQHFGKSADDFEIVNDIENRIAEMFTEILNAQQKKVIELADVEVVVGMMGSVKDFEEGADDEPQGTYTSPDYSAFGAKRIYRDKDEAMIAGVCSGLSHYLRMDVSILRIIAVMTVLLGGSGLIAYLILWIAIPAASTRAEKMSMKGEAPNLQGFKRSFEEELSALKDNLMNAGDQMKPLVKQSRGFLVEFFEVLNTFLRGAGRSLFKVIAVLIMISGSVALVFSLIALATLLGLWDSGVNGIFPLNMVDATYIGTFGLAVFVVVAIPLLAVVLLSVRVAFNSQSINRTLAYSLLLIWICGLSISIFYIAKISAEFKEEAEFTQNIPVKAFPGYTLEIDRSRFFSKEDSIKYRLDATEYTGKVIQDDDRPLDQPRNVTIRIEKSDTQLPSVVQSYSAKGINFETALYHAKNIHYQIKQQDSVLRFNTQLTLMKNVNWRNQEVEVVFKIPVGTRLKIDRHLDRYVQGYSFWDCGEDNSVDKPYYGIMTEDGLKCQFEQ